jgi:hypothetical protein
MPTADLLLLLTSRDRRLNAWDWKQRYANWPRSRSEYNDSDDDNIVIDVSAELATRIDRAQSRKTF